MRRQVALVSEHASPLGSPGGVDCGGQNVYVAQVARQLAAMGYAVDVFTRRDSPCVPEVVEWAEGVRVVHVPAGPARFIPKEELLPHMDEFLENLLGSCRRRLPAYDLLHANFWMSGWAAAEVKRALGIPFVVTFHALGRVRRRHQGSADAFPDRRFEVEERVAAEADRVIAECPQDAADLTALYAADRERISVVPCGFDPVEFWPMDRALARRAVGLPVEGRVVLQLGRLVPRKGVDTAIRGFARLVHGHGVAARMVVVGGESEDPDPALTPEIARLRGVAREEGVEERVAFVGRRRRALLRYYYNAADAFVTTPWYEPFGITPLEAMACGTPVVGASVGGIKYTVRDGETGFLVPPDDPGAVGERLARLFSHPELAERMGREGVRRVNGHFTWRQVANALAALYESVLDEDRARRRSGAAVAAAGGARAKPVRGVELRPS